MRKKLLASILGGFLFLLMCSRLYTISPPASSPMISTPLSADVTVLEYGHYTGFYVVAEGNDVIAWNYSSSNNLVGIHVMAINASEFVHFYTHYIYECYPLNTGDYSSDSGSFEIPYSDTWYLIFYNTDFDIQTTILTYYSAIDRNYFGGTYLAYGAYVYSNFADTLMPGDIVDWSWESSSNIVRITAMAMNETEFNHFISKQSYNAYSLSTGGFYKDSGLFTIPYEAHWYFVFLHLHANNRSTDICWEVTLETTGGIIDITSPDSSDIWTVGTAQYIYYTVNDDTIDYVDIFLYQDGSYLSTIATHQEATGAFNWSIPIILYENSNYQIYIQNYSNPLVNDLSDPFPIENPHTIRYNVLYNDYQYWCFGDFLTASDIIEWSFISTNPNVGIRVLAMDSPNFINFSLGIGTYVNNYYTLCFNETEDDGLFRMPYDGIWYVVFINFKNQPTNLYWNITLEEFTDDEFEENDRLDEAKEIAKGTYTDLAALDEDWYFINLTKGQNITIDLNFIHSNGDINLYLRDKYGNLVDYSETTTDNEHIEFTIVTADKYYIVVTSSIFSPNPVYDMVVDVSTPTTTTTTTTSTTETSTTETTTISSENPFKIPGYPFLVILGAVMLGFVTIIYWRKTHK